MELIARDLKIAKLNRVVTWPCMQIWALVLRVYGAGMAAAVCGFETVCSWVLAPVCRRLTLVLVPCGDVVINTLRSICRQILRPFFSGYWKAPVSAGALMGAAAFAHSFVRTCDAMITGQGQVTGRVQGSPTVAAVFFMAAVSLLSVAAQILGSIGQGSPGSVWEKIRCFGIRLSKLLDLGLVTMLTWLLPRLWKPIRWGLMQLSSIFERLLWLVRGLSTYIFQGVQRVTNSVVWGCWTLLHGIWTNSPLAFAASMSVLFTLYKVHRGEWVLLSEVTSTHVTDICAGFVAWMRKTPGVVEEQVSSCAMLLRPLFHFLEPMATWTLHGAAHLSARLADEKIPMAQVVESPSTAFVVWLLVAILGQGSASTHSSGVAISMLLLLTLLTFARQLIMYGGAAVVLHLCVCSHVRSGEREMVRQRQRHQSFSRPSQEEQAAADPIKLPDHMFNTQCPVCMVDFDEGEEIAGLECGHQYHTECFERWMDAGHLSCPTCRHRPERSTRAGRFAQIIFS